MTDYQSYHINLHCTQYHFVMTSDHNIPAPSFFSGCQENPTKRDVKNGRLCALKRRNHVRHPNWKVPEASALRMAKETSCWLPVKLHNGCHFCLKVTWISKTRDMWIEKSDHSNHQFSGDMLIFREVMIIGGGFTRWWFQSCFIFTPRNGEMIPFD